MNTVTVQFLRGTGLGGIGNDAHPGDRMTLPEGQAQALIAAGRAVPVADPAPEQVKPRRKKGE